MNEKPELERPAWYLWAQDIRMLLNAYGEFQPDIVGFAYRVAVEFKGYEGSVEDWQELIKKVRVQRGNPYRWQKPKPIPPAPGAKYGRR